MSIPSNTTALTAIDIAALPYDTTQNANDAGTTYDLWYKYTATFDGEIGVWANSADYDIETSVWLDPAAAPVEYPNSTNQTISNNNKPIQLYVTNGVTYYFKFRSIFGDVTPSVLVLNVQKLAVQAVNIGDLFVPDDADGYPAIIASATDGAILKAVPFPAGEWGDVLDNGKILAVDKASGTTKFFDTDFTLLATIPFNASNGMRLNRASEIFYLGRRTSGPTNGTVRTVDNTGTLFGPVYDLGIVNLSAIAPNHADTILYYSNNAAGNNIFRWNLLTNSALSQLAGTGVSGHSISDFLTLPDDTFIAIYLNGISNTNVFARHYDAAGTLLNTYLLDDQPIGGILPPKLAYAIDHPNSFWVWTHLSIASHSISRFKNIKISDGSVLTTFDIAEYEHGAYGAADTVTPTRFGISNSCPFLLLRTSIAPPAAEGTIVVNKVTLPDTDTTSFDFTATGLTPGTFSLANGGSQVFNNVPVGSGYGIAETPVAGYDTTYVVSNGSPIDNISVAEDETVTITVTNTKRGKLIIGKVSDPFSGTKTFHFSASGGLTPTTFDLASEEDIEIDDLPAGNGYSVVETPDPDYAPYYLLSNADANTNTNITIGPGEEVVLMILNNFDTKYSGLYQIVPDKSNDTVFDAGAEQVDVKKPNPYFETGMVGDL